MTDKAKWVRIGSLVVGLLGMIVAGVVRSFNVFAVPLKSRLNFSQTEIEFIAGAGNVGELLGIPAYLFFKRYGARWTSLLGLVMTFVGFLLLWMSTHMDALFVDYYMLVGLFYFMAAHGTIYTYISCLMTNIENFSVSHCWKVNECLELSHIAGAPIFAGIFAGVFKAYLKEDSSNPLGNFFILVAICAALVNVLGMIFLRNPSIGVAGDEFVVHSHLGHREDNSNEYSSLVGSEDSYHYSSVSGGTSSSTAVLVEDELPDLRSIFQSWSVQYIMWTLTLSIGVGLMFYNNITVILQSLKWEEHDVIFTVVLPIISLVAHFIIVSTSDYLSQKVPKSIVMLILIMILLGSQIFLIFYVGQFDILVGTSIMVYVATPCLISVGASLLRDRLAAGMFEKTWWIITSVIGLGACLIQLSFGGIYDGYDLSNHVGHDCYGADCFMWSFIMSSCVCACAIILNIGLIKLEW